MGGEIWVKGLEGFVTVLRYPLRFLILGLVTGGAFLACVVVSFGARTGGPIVAASFLVFALPGLTAAGKAPSLFQ